MVFKKKQYYSVFVAVPLLIFNCVGVSSFISETPAVSTTKAISKSLGEASSPSLSLPTSLGLSSYDSDYYVPTEQASQSGQSRITLSRFLSQYVKDHPEVSAILDFSSATVCVAGMQ